MSDKLETKGVDWSSLPQELFPGVGNPLEYTPKYFSSSVLTQHIMSQQTGHISEMSTEGTIKSDSKDPKGARYHNMMEKLGGRLLHKWVAEGYYSSFYLFDHGTVHVEFSVTYVKVSALSSDEKFVTDMRRNVSKDFLPAVQSGHIFAIVRAGQRLSLSTLGDASIPLVSTNYTPSVLEDYNFVVKDLRSDNPSGRIVVMEGEPGTGKTHLIRAMLKEVSDAMFVLVSPEMVSSLAGPELLPLLLSNKQDYSMNGPIALVLEDADRCLVTRGENNLNSIQSLLNLGDGILGSLLDLRIIATTNAKKLEMEAAILRPGRLSKRLEVGPLDLDTARGVFRRLLPDVKFPEILRLKDGGRLVPFKMTLAEAYSLARKSGWKPEARGGKEKRASKYSNTANTPDDAYDD